MPRDFFVSFFSWLVTPPAKYSRTDIYFFFSIVLIHSKIGSWFPKSKTHVVFTCSLSLSLPIFFWVFLVKKRKKSDILFGIKRISYGMSSLWRHDKGSEIARHLMPPSSPYYFLSFASSRPYQCPLKPRGAHWVNTEWGEGVTHSITCARGTSPNITQQLQQILHLLCITPPCSKGFINSEGSKFFW